MQARSPVNVLHVEDKVTHMREHILLVYTSHLKTVTKETIVL